MAGELPPITPPPSLPAKPDGLLIRLWNAVFPSAAVPEEPAAQEGAWYWAVFRPWSLPARVAVFVALVLVAIVFACWLEFHTNPFHVPWRYSLTPIRSIAVVLLLLLIPMSVFQALKLLFQGEKSQFPDIDAAWQAGKDALRKQGLSLSDKPLFLVLGSPDEEQERSLFATSNATVLVAGIPDGPAPLHWYVNADRIFLCCTGASWLSALSAMMTRRAKGIGESGTTAGDHDERAIAARQRVDTQRFAATIQPQSLLGTTRGFRRQTSYPTINPLDDPAPTKNPTGHEGPPGGAATAGVPSSQPKEDFIAMLQPSDAAEQEDRLESICELLRTARYPYSPINGCITLIPFAAANADPQEIDELARAVNADLRTLHSSMHVRYPVTAIFTGMEEEAGFRELMRRVGPERCAATRFGLGYDLRSPASTSEIGAFADHVCGVFEDWVYGLFREDQVLKRPGNASLFSLLCRVRSSFKNRLSELLSQGFGYSNQLKAEDAPFLFSGCYFVASGGTPDHRAFIRGISEKLGGEQDRLEWNRHAVSSARSARRLVVFAIVMVVVLAVLLGVMTFLRPPWKH